MRKPFAVGFFLSASNHRQQQQQPEQTSFFSNLITLIIWILSHFEQHNRMSASWKPILNLCALHCFVSLVIVVVVVLFYILFLLWNSSHNLIQQTKLAPFESWKFFFDSNEQNKTHLKFSLNRTRDWDKKLACWCKKNEQCSFSKFTSFLKRNQRVNALIENLSEFFALNRMEIFLKIQLKTK